jgi:hypothetical protein
MADVTVGAKKRIALLTGVKKRLVFDPPIANIILKKIGAGTIAYMINAVETDMADIDEEEANTLDDNFPTRDLFKPSKIENIVMISDADVTIELDTEKAQRQI